MVFEKGLSVVFEKGLWVVLEKGLWVVLEKGSWGVLEKGLMVVLERRFSIHTLTQVHSANLYVHLYVTVTTSITMFTACSSL